MSNRPTAFISYSHSDKDFTSKLATDLMRASIDVWIDKFEIRPGDSLIQKIFTEGLSQSNFFLVILSVASTTSKWVREELDAAMIQKIAGVTRIIPIVKESCEIPVPLRSLLYVDLSKDYEHGLQVLVKTMHGVFDKPPIGKIPEYVSTLKQSVGGLSKHASTLGMLLLSTKDDELGFEPQLASQEIEQLLPDFTPEEINDAVDELESFGLVKSHKVFGNAPYDFAYIAATYALFIHFKDEGLGYDPEEDIKQVAAQVSTSGDIKGDELQERLHITPGRLNRAVAYLDEYGLARVLRTLGTAPYDFREVSATRQTRNFVNENSR
jgi:hypothetical protein